MFSSRNIALLFKKSFIAYPNVELFGFKVDAFKLFIIEEKLAAFRNFEFPNTLKALEKYISKSGFIRYLLLYYGKISEPFQNRKVLLLTEGRKLGAIIAGNPVKRANYYTKTIYIPTETERESFTAVQKTIYNNIKLYYFDPNK